MAWQHQRQPLGLRGQIIMEARFAGQQHISPSAHRVGQQFAAGAAGNRHSPHLAFRIADHLNRTGFE
jgi:hypothetical protein